MTLNLKTAADVTLSFDKVQGLRNLEDETLSLSAFCKGSVRVIEEIRGIVGAEAEGIWSLRPYHEQLIGYVEDLAVLTKRIANTIDLVSLYCTSSNHGSADGAVAFFSSHTH